MTILVLFNMVAGLAAIANGQATQPVSSIPSGAPVVDLGYTSYLGYNNETSGITYYRGIQFAQPPVGALRWQKPRPIEGANDFERATLNATQIGPSCYQSAPGSLLLGGMGSAIGVRCLSIFCCLPDTEIDTGLAGRTPIRKLPGTRRAGSQ
jgi:hypothetical protein